MPIVFKTEEQRNPTQPVVIGEQAGTTNVEEDLTQMVYKEGEEEKLAIQFLEENGLYTKFLLCQGIQDQLKKLKDSLGTQEQ